MANVLFRVGSASEYSSLASKDQLTFYYLQDSQRLYLGEVEITSAAALADVVADVAQNAADIADIQAVLTTIQGDDSVSGSMKNLIKLASNTLMAEINKKTTEVLVDSNGNRALNFNEIDGGGAKFENANGIMSFTGVNGPVNSDNDIAGQLYVVKKNDETNKYEGTRLNMTRGGMYYLKGDSSAFTADNELATLGDIKIASDGATAKTVYLVDESSGAVDVAKKYAIYQGSDNSDMTNNTLIGYINIPLDKFLKYSSIVTITYSNGELYDDVTDVTSLIKGDIPATAADAGKYIKLEMQNVDDPLYVNLSDFIDLYTVNNQTSEITLSIDGNNNITATVGEIGANKVLYTNSDNTTTSVQNKIASIETNLTWQSIE